MADVTLSDGREITFDLYKITITEFRTIRDPGQSDEVGDQLLANVSGLELEDVQSLPYPDWRNLVDKFYEKALRPAPEKN